MSTLIERLESAEAGSRELSDAVLLVCQLPRIRGAIRPSPTESVDDALALVPGGFGWEIDKMITLECEAILYGHDVHASADAATPALALCAAILRARQSESKQ